MPTWLEIAKGPWMRFALAIFCLGLLRLLFLTIWDIINAAHRGKGLPVPYSKIIRETANWLFPFGKLHRTRGFYSYASFFFHIGFLITGFFLINHIEILRFNTGLSWFAVQKPVLDAITFIAIGCGLFLLLYRLYVHSSRALSQSMDYILLILILNIMISGFLAGRTWNPLPYDQLMLFHTLNGLAILVLAPFTKIAHCILFPLIRLSSEFAWRLEPHGGEKVVKTLHGPQGRKI